jgi:hypothetical protein
MTRKVCRADHPSIAITLRNIAQVYERQGRKSCSAPVRRTVQ